MPQKVLAMRPENSGTGERLHPFFVSRAIVFAAFSAFSHFVICRG